MTAVGQIYLEYMPGKHPRKIAIQHIGPSRIEIMKSGIHLGDLIATVKPEGHEITFVIKLSELVPPQYVLIEG